MFSPTEARKIAQSAGESSSREIPESVEERIDRILKESAAGGQAGCYLEWHDLGDDPDAIIEKYRENGWEVEYNDKINSWLFQPKDTQEEIDAW